MTKIKNEDKNNDKFNNFIVYYENNWFPLLEKGIIDYSAVEDGYRCNSYLENYNKHIKSIITGRPN